MLYETRRTLLGFRLKLTFGDSLNKDTSCIFVDVSKTKTVGILLDTITERFEIPRNSYLTVQNCRVLPSESVCVLLDVNSVKIIDPSTSTAEVRGTQTSDVFHKDNASEETSEVISCNEGDVVDGKSTAFRKPRPPKRPARDGIAATIKMLLAEEEMDKIGKECSELSLSNDKSKIQPTSHQETMNVDEDEAEINFPAEELSDFTSDACSDLNVEKKKRKRKRKHAKNRELEDPPASSSSFTEPVPEVRQDTNNPRPRHIRFDDDADDKSKGPEMGQVKIPIKVQSLHQLDRINQNIEELQKMTQKSRERSLKFQLESLMKLKRQLVEQSQQGLREHQGLRQQQLPLQQLQLLQRQLRANLQNHLNDQVKLYELLQQINPLKVSLLCNPHVSFEPVSKSDAVHIWRGFFEWQSGTTASTLLVDGFATPDGEIDKFDLSTEQWPRKLDVLLLPREFLQSMEMPYFVNSTTVLFDISLGEVLKEDLGTDYVGYVQLNKTIDQVNDLQVLILRYCQQKKSFVGFIPKDQTGFIDRCYAASDARKQSYVLQLRSFRYVASVDPHGIDDRSSAVLPSCSEDQSSQKSTKNQFEQSASTASATRAKSENNYNRGESHHRPKSSIPPHNGSITSDQDYSVSSFINLPQLAESENVSYKPKHDRVEKELATLLMCKQLNTSMEYTVQFADKKGNRMPVTSTPLSKSVNNGLACQSAVSQPNRAAWKSDASNSLFQNVKIEENRENDVSEQMEASSDDCEFLKQVKLDGTRIRLRKFDGTWTVLTPEIADTELPKLEVPKENQSIVFQSLT